MINNVIRANFTVHLLNFAIEFFFSGCSSNILFNWGIESCACEIQNMRLFHHFTIKMKQIDIYFNLCQFIWKIIDFIVKLYSRHSLSE